MAARKGNMLNKLEKTFEDMGIEIKYDKLKGDGGYCKYKDKEFIVLNKILPGNARIRILKEILREKISNGEDIYIIPAVREFIEEQDENN